MPCLGGHLDPTYPELDLCEVKLKWTKRKNKVESWVEQELCVHVCVYLDAQCYPTIHYCDQP